MLRINFVLREISLYDNGIGGDDGARAIAEALEFNSSLKEIGLRWNEIGAENVEICEQALGGCRNRRKMNYCLWICSFIAHLRSTQSLGFDDHMIVFYFYLLLDIELRK
jgi:hypothetical protein